MLFERFCLEELPKLAISLLVNCLAFRIALSFSNPSIIRNQIDVSFWAATIDVMKETLDVLNRW
jgi:hypothetical protein